MKLQIFLFFTILQHTILGTTSISMVKDEDKSNGVYGLFVSADQKTVDDSNGAYAVTFSPGDTNIFTAEGTATDKFTLLWASTDVARIVFFEGKTEDIAKLRTGDVAVITKLIDDKLLKITKSIKAGPDFTFPLVSTDLPTDGIKKDVQSQLLPAFTFTMEDVKKDSSTLIFTLDSINITFDSSANTYTASTKDTKIADSSTAASSVKINTSFLTKNKSFKTLADVSTLVTKIDDYKPGMTWWWWLIIVAGALLIIAGLVSVILCLC